MNPPLDEIRLGDCMELLRMLPDACVDLIVSSPPYNLGKDYESRRALEVYLDEQAAVLKQCSRVLKPTGSIFWQVGVFAERGIHVPLDVRFFPILESLGLLPRNRIVWARQHGLHATRKYSCRYETILWFTRSDDYYFDLDAIRVPQKYPNKTFHRGAKHGQLSCHPDGKNPGDIWMFRNVKHNHEEQTIHPCQFPEDMIARIILSTTAADAVVLDPYMGTGTVAVVARDHSRRFLGAELDPSYHAVALRRLSGEPDENGCFANLKTLRDYCERTGKPVAGYRFDVQVGERATERRHSKIYPEAHHLRETEERLALEEEACRMGIRNQHHHLEDNLDLRCPEPSESGRIDVSEFRSTSHGRPNMDNEPFERSLRAFQRRTPFHPFTVALVNGDRFQVDHPEALVVRGGVAVFITANGVPTLFDHESVSQMIGEPMGQATA